MLKIQCIIHDDTPSLPPPPPPPPPPSLPPLPSSLPPLPSILQHLHPCSYSTSPSNLSLFLNDAEFSSSLLTPSFSFPSVLYLLFISVSFSLFHLIISLISLSLRYLYFPPFPLLLSFLPPFLILLSLLLPSSHPQVCQPLSLSNSLSLHSLL